ncbi:ATP-binding cassette domain-containing protein [Variovorax sp. J22R133]|uniref:ATP-binding cassette domain-containing protein n=1 Tax=Variovorax brevis TaxID=3053503 RepID=UPI0025773434|nr:ATP-binding cassette domain-containing protein [Variovorax sp. J22R133]MDM0116122.1 ATP-binding cassette domain-containing protein [Variovorax sp. J22R133]
MNAESTQQMRALSARAIEPVLRLQDIRKTFGAVRALKGVSLSIQLGEVHAIVGENGAGKSTLINVAAGVLLADGGGSIVVQGREVEAPNPQRMRDAGISVAFQHPALPSDLTVLEALCLVQPSLAGAASTEASALLDRVSTPTLRVQPHQRIGDLGLAQRHVVEIARALASKPKVLILDEPTEPFQEADVLKLFELIRGLRDEGTSVIYISHRLHEVEAVADRISVLRDGELIETRDRVAFTHDQIIQLIVGQPLGQVFPAKGAGCEAAATCLEALELSGPGFAQVSLKLKAGEIVGLAGVEGQGQRDFLTALAGITERKSGRLSIHGNLLQAQGRAAALRAGIGYVPGDRHAEGLFMSLSVQDNIAIRQFDSIAHQGVIDSRAEQSISRTTADSLAVKAASLDTPVGALSGGNQQKVLIGREIAAAPKVLLIDEPTVGVDIGSKAEIYHQLRTLANGGMGIVISASDGVEVEGLCDRVLVFARGRVSAELAADEVTDERITAANLQATGRRESSERDAGRTASWTRSVYFPAAILAALTLVLGIVTASVNARFVSTYNLGIMLTFLAALGFIAFAQLLVVLIGEIDLSLGPIAGLVVVLASFMMPSDGSALMTSLGGAGIVLLAGAIGFLQGLAVAKLRLPAVVVTLGTFFGLQGLSLVLRPLPSGTISDQVHDLFGHQFLAVPLAAALMLALMFGFERVLFRSSTGRWIRATGSDRVSAHKLGVNRALVVPAVFAAAGVLTGLGGLILAGEVGVGSPSVGTGYTLMSITAVVLGGAAITGGRGSFVCTLLGAVLVQLVFSATSFLALGAEWQNWMVGVTTLLAAALYRARR